MIDGEARKSFLEAARIASSVRDFAEDFVKPGLTLLEIAERIEEETIKAGGQLGFPANTSINTQAAHYTPKIGDSTLLGADDLIKVDFGVQVDGYIVDQAFSRNFSGKWTELIKASEDALANAIKAMKPGKTTGEIGKVIEDTIRGKGFVPISNLCGHSIDQYVLHAGVAIPNTARGNDVLEEGDVYAIEPFATTGVGLVTDGSYCQIYSLVNPKNVRLPQSRKVLEYLSGTFQTLPFAKRHLLKALPSEASIDLALADLTRQGILTTYPVLVEENNGMVSQAETTVIIEKDGAKPLV